MEGPHTLLCEPPTLVVLKFFVTSCSKDCGIAARLGQGKLHRFLEELETLDLVDGALGRLRIVKHDERLSLCLDVGLGDYIDYCAIFGEDGHQGFLEKFWLDALLEISDIHPIRYSGQPPPSVSECNDTYVAIGAAILEATLDSAKEEGY